MTSERCMTHLFEKGDRICGHCGNLFCADCLVQPFPKKPPLCKNCAIIASGIRSHGLRQPARSRKEIKAMYKAQEQAERQAREETARDRKLKPAPAVIQAVFNGGEPDVVPPQLSKTVGAARTKRLWRTAG